MEGAPAKVAVRFEKKCEGNDALPYLISAYYVVIGICGAFGLLHLMIFLRRREETVHLVFAFMALCCAIATLLDIQTNLAENVTMFVRSLKATNTVQVFLRDCSVPSLSFRVDSWYKHGSAHVPFILP